DAGGRFVVGRVAAHRPDGRVRRPHRGRCLGQVVRLPQLDGRGRVGRGEGGEVAVVVLGPPGRAEVGVVWDVLPAEVRGEREGAAPARVTWGRGESLGRYVTPGPDATNLAKESKKRVAARAEKSARAGWRGGGSGPASDPGGVFRRRGERASSRRPLRLGRRF